MLWEHWHCLLKAAPRCLVGAGKLMEGSVWGQAGRIVVGSGAGIRTFWRQVWLDPSVLSCYLHFPFSWLLLSLNVHHQNSSPRFKEIHWWSEGPWRGESLMGRLVASPMQCALCQGDCMVEDGGREDWTLLLLRSKLYWDQCSMHMIAA